MSADLNPAEPPHSLEQLREALERQTRVAAALRDVGTALGATLDLDELLELILNRLTELVGADRAILYLLDARGTELVSRVVQGGQVRSLRVKVGEGIAGSVARTGRPIRLADAHADPRFESEWDLLTGYETRSILAAPLRNNLGRIIGVIQVLNKRGGEPFSDEDEAILTTLSTQAAVAIDNSRLLLSLIQKNKQLTAATNQLERRVQDLELLFQLERSTAHARSHDELAAPVLAQLARACNAGATVLLLRDAETGHFVEYIHEFDGKTRERPVDILASVVGRAVHQEQGLHWQGQVGGRRSEFHASYDFELTEVLAEPLQGEDSPLGAIGLCNKRHGENFSEEDVALLRLVSANVSTAVRLSDANRAREREQRLTSIGRVLSQVIHDFKSPMTVISGYVQLMEETSNAKQRAEYAEAIVKQFEVLSSMQREVLAFARGESEVFIRRVYLDRFFQELTEQLHHELDGRGIELTLQLQPKLVVHFDTERLTRALFNLVRNAAEAMNDRGGTVTIAARRDDTDLVIVVGDTGPGVPASIADRLFESFVTEGKPEGTGLGLAIVRTIVEQHGGTVRLMSPGEFPTSGAAFELRLPERSWGAPPVSSSSLPPRSE